MQSRTALALFFITTFLAGISQSQCSPRDTASLKGVVRSIDGQAVSGVRTTLLTLDGIVVATSNTLRDGSYKFDSVPGGAYQIQVTRNGDMQWQPVHVCNSTLLNITLQPRSPSIDPRAQTISVQELQVPEKAQKAYHRAIQSYVKNRLKDTEKFVNKAIESCPRFAQALTLRGVLRLSSRHFAQADEDLLSAVQVDPGNHATYVILAESYNAQGRYDDAEQVSKKGIALWSNSWLGYYELARSMVGKHEYQAALSTLDKTEQMKPTQFSVTHVLRAYALTGLENYKEAKVQLQQYLAEDPTGAAVPAAQALLQILNSLEGAAPRDQSQQPAM